MNKEVYLLMHDWDDTVKAIKKKISKDSECSYYIRKDSHSQNVIPYRKGEKDHGK